MRRVGLRALLAGMMTIGLGSAAWGGTITSDRTDLLDVDNFMLTDKLDSPLTTNRALLELRESSSTGLAFGSGSVVGPGTGTTQTRIQWMAFEPDQMHRDSKQGSLQQKDQVALRVVINNLQVFPTLGSLTPVPGCKAVVHAQTKKGSTTVNKGDWSVNCNGKKAGSVLTLTDAQLSALQTALGKKVVGKNSLNIKGKCTDANCND